MYQLQKDVAAWADPILGTELKGPVLHLWEEIQEGFRAAVDMESFSSVHHEELKMESADQGLCLMHIAALLGIDLPPAEPSFEIALRAKFEICKAREWYAPDEHGVVRHVKEPA